MQVLTSPTLVGLSMALLISLVSAVPEALAAWRRGAEGVSTWDSALAAVRAQAARRGVTVLAWRAAWRGALWWLLTLALSPPALMLAGGVLCYRLWRGAAGLALRVVLVLALEAALLAKHRGHYTGTSVAS